MYRAGLALEIAMGLLKLGRFESAETVLTDVLEHARELEDERLELAADVSLHLRANGARYRDRRRASPDRLCSGRPAGSARRTARAWPCPRSAPVSPRFGDNDWSSSRGRAARRSRRCGSLGGDDGKKQRSWNGSRSRMPPSAPIRSRTTISSCGRSSSAAPRIGESSGMRCSSSRSRGPIGASSTRHASWPSEASGSLRSSASCQPAVTSLQITFIELSAGDLVNAERDLRRAHAELQRVGAENPLASVSANLALVLSRRGDVHEVFAHIDDAERVPADDLEHGSSQVRHARGRSRPPAASRTRRMPRGPRSHLWEGSDNVFLGAQALAALAHVLQLRGKTDEARETLARELAMHERKLQSPGG